MSNKLKKQAEAVNKALDKLQNNVQKETLSVHNFEQRIDKCFEKLLEVIGKLSDRADQIIFKRRDDIEEATKVLKKYGR